MVIPSAVSACRVWIRSNPCPFGISVFDTLANSIGNDADLLHHRYHYDRLWISLKEQEPKMSLRLSAYDTSLTTSSSNPRVPMGRAREYAPFGATACPTTVTKKKSSRKPFVGLAVVGMLLDPNQQRLLITRRPSYMRSFPDAWVFPGGGVDEDESLSEAMSREILEETGLQVDDEAWRIQSVWESVYPTQVTAEQDEIKAHHIVVYLSATLSSNQDLQLCEEEVGGAVWLSRDNVRYILFTIAEQSRLKDASPSILEGAAEKTVKMQMNAQTKYIPLGDLVGIYPQTKDDDPGGEEMHGLAQGSLFALEEFWMSEWSDKT